ncbi:MAG: fibronectin type III domain-containing protein, partial [Chloroflexi bacterium]|nr:fibronectin type III domain-containing protein [Chloroflexota bacterium]
MVSSALVSRSRLLALGGVLAAILIVVAAVFPGHSVAAQETIPVPAPVVTPEPTPAATPEPTPEATPEPTPEATPEPTPEATPEPTPAATPEPLPEATPEPTPEATPEPTPEATPEPTPEATPEPTPAASPEPTPEATAEATPGPTTEKSTETGEATPPQTAKQVQGQVNRPDAPGNLSAVRASSTTQMKPALDVTWTTPADNGATITRYEVYYGTDKNNMTKVTTGATATSVRLTDLAAGTTYHVRVLAFAGNEGQNGTAGLSADTTGTTNTPPKPGARALEDAELIRGPLSTHSTDANRWGEYFTDADGDTLTPSVQPQYQGLLKALASTGSDYSIRVEGLNPGTSKLTYGVSDGYGGFASKDVTYTIVDNPARAVPENSPAGTVVGAPVAGTPYDDGDDSTDDALTHTLHGEAATYFDIDAATGQISVKQGTSLDYETEDSYTGQVKWTVQDQEATANLTINVTDVGAGKPDAPTLTRTQFSEQSDPALDVEWTAAAALGGATITGHEAQYRKKVADGEEANAWTLYEYEDPNNPGTQISELSATTTSINLPGLEAGATYESRGRGISSEEGAGPWSDIGEGTANRAPAWNGVFFLDIGTLTWNSIVTIQNSLANHFTDADGDTLTYSASSEYVGIINAWVEGDHPKLRVHNPAASEVTFRASDPYGGVSDTFTHTYVGSANVTRTVPENSPADTMVGDRVQGRPYNGQALTYTLTGELADSGHFYIKPFGRIRVKSGANLDYETTSTYTGKVEYTIQGQPVAINVTINVIDVEAGKPDAPTLSRTEFSEKSNPALDVTWTAPDANGSTITGYEAQYRVKVADGETANAWTDYTIDDGNDGQTKTLPASTRSFNLPNLTPGDTYEVQVRALTQLEGEGPWSDIGEGTANRPPT